MAGVWAIAVLALALTTGCMPEPEPTPSPTGFASEEEAFAAAEETYRAYVDALNQVDLSDPETFEPVYALTTGEALNTEKTSLTSMHANDWTVSGNTLVGGLFVGGTRNSPTAVVCLDVTEVEVRDAEGVSQVAPERRDRYALDVRFTAGGHSPTGLLIEQSRAVEDERCE
ncbi:conserved exported hypothetical protein [uncultured Microbacterium sp.]|uniref:Lipoprotein n=2 Tax=uncultured Microbacterium sp. TaxID=191216 RepID=A0A1Y5P5M6_9MICO|nr:conserved exported hypothetical protein [uncultured Microbacterium sp.]